MLLLVIHVSVALTLAQANTSTLVTCDPTAIAQAELSFQHRKDGLKAVEQSERDLKALLRTCPLTVARSRFEKRLTIVQEEVGETNVSIALFYLHVYLHGGGMGRVKGALSRLQRVDQEYPRFSKRDYTLYLLAELSERNDSRDDAVNYYRRIIVEHPHSIYAKRARKRLAEFSLRTMHNKTLLRTVR